LGKEEDWNIEMEITDKGEGLKKEINRTI